jgi:hypothetical protein
MIKVHDSSLVFPPISGMVEGFQGGRKQRESHHIPHRTFHYSVFSINGGVRHDRPVDLLKKEVLSIT